jgi:hypothetical protein
MGLIPMGLIPMGLIPMGLIPMGLIPNGRITPGAILLDAIALDTIKPGDRRLCLRRVNVRPVGDVYPGFLLFRDRRVGVGRFP